MAIPNPPAPGGALLCAGPSPLPAPGADPAALDLHEGIGTSRLDDPRATGCKRWPEQLRLLNHSTGELVPGRCRATNLCAYCARLFAVETSEMLLLDAMEDAPTLYVVLTAREHLTRDDCRGHLRHLRRSLRARWPQVRWATTVEFQKRGALHLNLLVKGVDRDELDAFHEAIVGLWCSRVDALPSGQWSDVMADAISVVQYVSLHFMKSSQAPAIGWRGHRYSSTRDYLVRPASVMRQEARQALRLKRLLHRGLDVETASIELAAANATTWTMEHVNPAPARRAVDRPRPVDRPELIAYSLDRLERRGTTSLAALLARSFQRCPADARPRRAPTRTELREPAPTRSATTDREANAPGGSVLAAGHSGPVTGPLPELATPC